MKNNSLIDFQENWKKLVDKAFENYTSMSKDERIWFNIQCLIQAVDNGGLISHYYNSGADFNLETIQDLNSLGFQEIAAILSKINQLFPNHQPSKSIEERNEVMESWPDGIYDNLLEELDQQFNVKKPELEKALMLLIEKI